MLRFDVPPVWSNAARMDALVTFVLSGLALLGWPLVLPMLVVMGGVRGFIGHQKCPSHRAYARWLSAMGWGGKQENAGAKMFANKLLFLAGSVATVLYFVGMTTWVVPVTVLLVFSFLELAFAFCAACWVYTLWYRLRG